MTATADPTAVRLLYSPHTPTIPQHGFLLLGELTHVLEALYGGAAGGGKSDALLMDALRYVDVPGYSALLLRRTYGELTQADGLITRAEEWLGGTDATYSVQDARWTFPSGATLAFGYLKTAIDHLRYQGGAYQFIGFDELTQFREQQYRYLLSRLRRPSGLADDNPLSRVPLRMRGATNPGGPGHGWVKRRFIERLPDPEDPDDTPEAAAARIFIPARLEDNPHLDQAAYRRSLAGLPRAERQQLLAGDWDTDTGDKVYDPAGVRAAFELGDVLDELETAGELPAPARPIRLGIDFGEHSHGLLIYPLPHGSLYVRAGEAADGVEVGTFTTRLLDTATRYLPRWRTRRPGRDLLTLIRTAFYDPGSAGAQSVRTFRKRARLRHHGLRTVAVPFNAYKRETIDYLRWLVENAADVVELDLDPLAPLVDVPGEPPLALPFLAVSANAPDLRRQLPDYRKDPATGEPVKDEDHGPDALVCAAADEARRQRDRGELERRRLKVRAQRAGRLPSA